MERGTQKALLVPDRAVGADQSGTYLLVVDKDNVVQQRTVVTGELIGQLRWSPRADRGRHRGGQRHPEGHTGREGGAAEHHDHGGRNAGRQVVTAHGSIHDLEILHRPAGTGDVLAIVIVLIGAVALFALPVSQYPNVVPPTISVTTRYPGASADTVMNTVALPIEQQVNGVEGMIYMQSYSAADGTYTLIVTFAIGTDLNFAQVLVQTACRRRSRPCLKRRRCRASPCSRNRRRSCRLSR